MKKIVYVLGILISLSLSGCFHIIKPDVQQGNLITQAQVDQLTPGMSEAEVVKIMGEPVLINTFNSARLDYVYTNQPGNQARTLKRITCYFENHKLIKVFGSLHPTEENQKA